MSGSGSNGSDGSGLHPPDSSNPERMGRPAAPFWLSTNKVTVPDRVAGYVDRPDLLERMDPTRHRIVLLKAPGGFGKTVLLAESCRSLQRDGTIAAWLTLDADDSPQILDACLAFAFEQAGLDILKILAVSDIRQNRPGALKNRARLLGMAIERHGKPCVLVLDELEQLDDKASLALLEQLLAQGPANLHFVIACRELPASLDLASPVLAGRGKVLAAEDLRFTRADMAQFLGPGVSRQRVASLAQETSGWPIALRLLQNERFDPASKDTDEGMDFVDNWLASRLLRGLAEAERELLLDVGLFEWIDAGLLDEVLERGAKRRLESIRALGGLLESVRGKATDALRLHPLEGYVAEYLHMFAQADFARPMVRERASCQPALEAFLANNPDPPAVTDARRLLGMLKDGERQEREGPTFSHRELDVLRRLEDSSDKEIAAALALTPRGVRYHVGHIFEKLGVHDRRSAVRHARQIGLLP